MGDVIIHRLSLFELSIIVCFWMEAIEPIWPAGSGLFSV